ncbi:type I-D CRISPR-associated protein Cas10d/Csc3 [Halorientalis sp.]|uniref:type I-D CRISPR-associated protein Cas10d/Csc3 n=1 Tax=Halorientalis sp. TaxID=1931229 RepID=UPI00260952F3|nr:type I-D CRISPR-associated protein Cas10d/Csc3 [Halorientalis sp.]
MTRETHDTISTLAERAFDAIRPDPTNSKPYAIERVFRESVKAIKGFGPREPSRQDAVDAVAGRIAKLPNRSDQVYRVGSEKSESGDRLEERIEAYAEYFVDEVFVGLFDGKPARLKRRENGLADGFYAATRRLQRATFGNDGDGDSADEETDALHDE